MKKKANILMENIVFILLNLIFISILVFFVFSKSGSAAVLEEKYSKQIALILDSAKPVMKIKINMDDAIEIAKKEKYEQDLVSIKDNIVTVKLREKGGYSYSFFKDVWVEKPYLDNDGNYVLIINQYNENE